MPTEQQLQVLLDKQEIYELLCRYCRGCDRLDKELILSCFHPGAIDVHVGRTAGVHYGTIEEFLEKEFEGWKRFEGSQHHIMNHLGASSTGTSRGARLGPSSSRRPRMAGRVARKIAMTPRTGHSKPPPSRHRRTGRRPDSSGCLLPAKQSR